MKSAGSLLGLLWRTSRRSLMAAVALSTLLSLTEGVGLAMVFPVIALLGGSGNATPGPRTQMLFHWLGAMGLPRSAWLTALLLVVLVSVGALSTLNGMLASLTWSIVFPVRQRLAAEVYGAILHADWSFLARRRASDLTHFLTDELNRVSQLTGSLIALISNGMVGLLMLGVAVYLSPLLSLLLLLGLGLLIPWQRRTGRAIYDSGVEISARMRQVFDSSTERLQSLKMVKAYGAQGAELQMFLERHEGAMREMIGNQWRSAGSSRRFQLVTLGLLCGVILLGLNVLHLAAATMLIFLFAFVRALPRMNAVQSKANEVLSDLPAYAEICAFVEECRAHAEPGETVASAPTLRRELTLRGVSFAYAPGTRTVLEGIDLTLPAGRITAIAGDSGAGKSTIADLVMGLLLPQAGEVAADGVAITRENAASWRRQIGYVSQDTLLFHYTVRRNLLWAKPEATDEELAEAIAAASAGFVYTLAQGMETVVGDRGMMLSHGQRQRIALARALLLRPALLILDEATNSLDLENEEKILKTVQDFGDRVTTLLISHRPSAVRVAERVYVLEAGRIKATGTWEEVSGAVSALHHRTS